MNMASSLSIFSRPVSPPPRAVSPDIAAMSALNPLPLPPARSKRLSERSGTSNSSSRYSPSQLLRNTPSRGILKPTPPPSPGSPVSFISASSSNSSRGSTHTLSHRRSIQFAIPYRSPPASPTLASPPPPVPPIPAFALDSGASRTLPAHHLTLAPPPRPTRDPRRDGTRGGMTCTQFMSMQGAQPGLGRRNPARAPSTA
ncbi:hypothetical protein J3R30DRAFT_2882311 [Lentinula aciculospora]|uniref:Uncharacterized protein n=1 Tax=Lentinula aciculospora TaxID=153920 RepID=A0A9W9AAF8_9AGAR|nr:hypothetical protein J3R30DRAFT_2882311 [Lentinula aciculospora]